MPFPGASGAEKVKNNDREAFRDKTRLAFRQRWLKWGKERRRPGLTGTEMVVLSFLGLIIVGAVGMKFIPGLLNEQRLDWIDAFFTSTSAVCVTGLTVVDTGTTFSFAGQLYLLVMIQLGGLGMLSLASLIITALGGRPSLAAETASTGPRAFLPHVSSRKLILDIFRFTIFVEAAGAVVLYMLWAPRLGWGEAVWPSIFHSVSAFCNAGFSLWPDSLTSFSDSPMTIVVISLLIVIGGLGFLTMEDFSLFAFRRGRKRRLSLHTRLVFLTSGLLLAGGWVLFALFEWEGVFAQMSVTDKLSNSFFMSVTPRTAGYQTIDYSQASDSSGFLTIILMMIGASPGSTGGGMKTTTFALIGLLAWSRLRSRSTATFANRSIPEGTIQKAMGLFVIWTGVLVISVVVLSRIGDSVGSEESFLAHLFEATSAFNTVGLSMNLTASLPELSRIMIVILMFAGRVGPIAIATALTVRLASKSRYRYAYEDVVVG
jgi:trk system potassium uptake protein